MNIQKILSELKMSIQDTFAIGNRKRFKETSRIISLDHKVPATVTEVRTCWWIKINTKSVRRGPLDGARFPHIIYFSYQFNGVTYQGCSCISYYLRCPTKQEKITVFVDPQYPTQYAVEWLPLQRL